MEWTTLGPRRFHLILILLVLSVVLLLSKERLTSVAPSDFGIMMKLKKSARESKKLSISTVKDFNCVSNTLDPPALSQSERKSLESTVLLSKGPEVLSVLSQIVQSQIERINSPADCSSVNTLLCGHCDGACGFGCQFHHRVVCLMISYALNIPLIHDSKTAWSYSTPWEEIFKPLGSNCTQTPLTYFWTQSHTAEWWLAKSQKAATKSIKWDPCDKENSNDLDYPLIKGLAVDEEIGKYVARHTPTPEIWWISQFIKHGFQLNSKSEQLIEGYKESIGLTSECIGMHIRRTDKINEAKGSFHNLSEYFQVAKSFVSNATDQFNTKTQVYLASDDPQVYYEAKNIYSDFDILGFPMNPKKSRKDTLNELIRDVVLLHSCKQIICGMTSNVCRLLLELLNFSDPLNASNRLTSLDDEDYVYLLLGGSLSAEAPVKRYFNGNPDPNSQRSA